LSTYFVWQPVLPGDWRVHQRVADPLSGYVQVSAWS